MKFVADRRGRRLLFARKPSGLALAAVIALLVAACQTTATSTTQAPQQQAAGLSAEVVAKITELAERAVNEERYEDAQKLVERVLVHQPNDPRARLVNAELLLANGRHSDALQSFRALAEPGSTVRAVALQGQGITLLIGRKPQEAVTALKQAVAADATLWRAWNALGYYHDQRSEWSEAEPAYQHGLALRPDSALLHNNRGFSRLMQQRPQEAAADFVEAMRLQPDLQIAEANLRLALAWNGSYRRALAGVPRAGMAIALNNVGFVALLRGDLGEAEAYLVQAMEQDAGYNAQASKNLDYLKSVRDGAATAATAKY